MSNWIGNLSIGKLLGDGVMDDDNPMNLTLSRVVILACSGEGVNDCGLNIAHYSIKKGKLNLVQRKAELITSVPGVFICAERQPSHLWTNCPKTQRKRTDPSFKRDTLRRVDSVFGSFCPRTFA
jgi:hypothetical protein